MEMFKLIRMHSDELGSDAWFVERIEEKKGHPDYYGPWLSKAIATNNMNELNKRAI
jgi:hypothetical protein